VYTASGTHVTHLFHLHGLFFPSIQHVLTLSRIIISANTLTTAHKNYNIPSPSTLLTCDVIHRQRCVRQRRVEGSQCAGAGARDFRPGMLKLPISTNCEYRTKNITLLLFKNNSSNAVTKVNWQLRYRGCTSAWAYTCKGCDSHS
jgi:hypothetical protein